MYPPNDLYKKYLKDSDDGRLSSDLPDITKKYTLKIMNRAINCCPNWDNFLDVGASTGHYSRPLIKKFKKGAAVEPSPDAILKKLQQDNENFNLYSNYIENINFTENFDFILLADLFKHIPLEKIDNFVKKLSQIQETGGVVYLLTPNPLFCGPATESEIYYKKNQLAHHGHQKHYFKDELTEIFSQNSYQLLFYSYEEGRLRNFFKKYVFGLSIRVRKYSKLKGYKIIKPVLLLPLKFVFKLIEVIVFYNENKNRYNELDTISLGLAFRKK